MQWYYSAGGQQQGPVSQAELEALVSKGTVTAETLVWREGLPNWAAYSTVATSSPAIPGVPATAPVATGQARCAQCGQIFAQDDMVAFENSHICVSCKPLFFQKLKEGAPIGGTALWKQKKRLVAPLDAVFPSRCVKCNAPTDSPQKTRKLYWHHPAVYLALLINLIVYAIIAMCVRKRTTALVSMCDTHRASRRNAIITAWVLVVVGLGSIIGGIAADYGWVAGLGVLLLLGGIIYGIARGRIIYATKIDKERVWLGGCGKDFLAQFPEWSGP
ncbi:MAG: DUF4339 domain-containing protein [Chthoniobacter sp.]|uniref:DUF4339 domain-containing protein n=1 Tax=Chthoniobacter sp. TaxID=2510640 RepID=UPI0032A9A69B